ncbi:MAG: (E)-4-hydroxy-3-methylbut-2-enyl-diphosphate synthase [Myxococcota bacterium]|jgi:(E)-4-hydroxy-3-methylbut-2-enyl-diphosphate synthase|nr:(E)-4-hydroxy-3-methylbut-2-enyl-diphosphate synthase [Myxococcota bacterium]
MAKENPFVLDPWVGRRRFTREVSVGSVGVGGDNPIRLQSMTNTDTMDSRATVDQIERLVAAGCEIARVTAPSIRDAENLRVIRTMLNERGVEVPLVADIHFTPNAAMIAADCVEKVRVNPGNYADKKKFEVREYTDQEYADELSRVGDRFRPLVLRCKQNGVAMRIGTNHGSLSDRVMNRYGDSPRGMVESALEFLDVCEAESYYDVIFSMKASNAHVAIQAYRLLAARLHARGGELPSYPFHLGVTEAGDAEDGRIKSAIGIGSLLEDGIGDTIRVSLTEDPVREIPVAEKIARRAEQAWLSDTHRASPALGVALAMDPFVHQRRETTRVQMGKLGAGGSEPVRVELELDDPIALAGSTKSLREFLAALESVPGIACESLLLSLSGSEFASSFIEIAETLGELGSDLPLSMRISARSLGANFEFPSECARVVVDVTLEDSAESLARIAGVAAQSGTVLEYCLRVELDELAVLVDRILKTIPEDPQAVLGFSLEGPPAAHGVRLLASLLEDRGAGHKGIVLRHSLVRGADNEADLIEASIAMGGPLCDGFGDILSLRNFSDPASALDLSYRILQGARLRTTRTEYISCPSCGRTLFDLEDTTARIKSVTSHLKGVKIAVMGCIVNGPGEMADADFGYVGSGPGVVTLYAGQQVVARNIPEQDAPDRLLALIADHDS